MPQRGYIRLARGALQHPFFRRDGFSEFEAWLWLLSEAAWRPRQRRIKEFLVPLERGQVATSIRHLNDEWKWSKSKVERFLTRLKTETMIDSSADRGITVITICNYEKYQNALWDDDVSSSETFETPPRHLRDSGETPPGQSRDNTEALKHSSNETLNERSSAQETQLALIDVPVPERPKRASRSKKPVVTAEIQAGFDAWWAVVPVKHAKDRAFAEYVRLVASGEATMEMLHSKMTAYRASEEAEYRARRDVPAFKFTKRPFGWLNEGFYKNETADVPGGQGRLMSSASEGIHSYFDK